MTGKLTNTGELNWLLDDLTTRVGAVRQAVILSTDGLAVGFSKGLLREDAEHLSAVAAGFQSLARGADATSAAARCARPSWRWSRRSCSSPPRDRAPAWPC